jgi:hypothetical protein
MSHCGHLLLAPKGLVVVENIQSADDSSVTAAPVLPVSEDEKDGS